MSSGYDFAKLKPEFAYFVAVKSPRLGRRTVFWLFDDLPRLATQFFA